MKLQRLWCLGMFFRWSARSVGSTSAWISWNCTWKSTHARYGCTMRPSVSHALWCAYCSEWSVFLSLKYFCKTSIIEKYWYGFSVRSGHPWPAKYLWIISFSNWSFNVGINTIKYKNHFSQFWNVVTWSDCYRVDYTVNMTGILPAPVTTRWKAVNSIYCINDADRNPGFALGVKLRLIENNSI